MLLKTERLNLRPLLITDLAKIHALHSLPETDAFNTLGIPENIQSTQNLLHQWLQAQITFPRTAYIFCMEAIATNNFVGLIALNLGKTNYKSAQVWYKTHVNYWRKGFTTEALQKILDFAFNDLKLHRIEAGCAVKNVASIKVLEKAGMTREGRKRKILPIRGEWKDNYFFAILEEDYFANK